MIGPLPPRHNPPWCQLQGYRPEREFIEGENAAPLGRVPKGSNGVGQNRQNTTFRVVHRWFGRLCRKHKEWFVRVRAMGKKRPVLFRGRHFQDEIILVCVRWYLRYSLSYRDVEEMMIERGLCVDHSTIARWVLRAGGPICIELSIRRAAQSSSCSGQIAI